MIDAISAAIVGAMEPRTPHALRPVFALACAFGLLCSADAQAAVPSGATASLAALRQAYIDAVKSRNLTALEALFDTTRMTPSARASFRRHLSDDLGHSVSTVVLKDPEPTLTAEYHRYHAHFPQPVVKALSIDFVAPPGQANGTEYYVGSSGGRYFFVSAVQDDK